MREGILASFNEANATGGVNGRRLELVSYDDGYEPEKAIDRPFAAPLRSQGAEKPATAARSRADLRTVGRAE